MFLLHVWIFMLLLLDVFKNSLFFNSSLSGLFRRRISVCWTEMWGCGCDGICFIVYFVFDESEACLNFSPVMRHVYHWRDFILLWLFLHSDRIKSVVLCFYLEIFVFSKHQEWSVNKTSFISMSGLKYDRIPGSDLNPMHRKVNTASTPQLIWHVVPGPVRWPAPDVFQSSVFVFLFYFLIAGRRSVMAL